MPITVKGIRIDKVDILRDNESGQHNISEAQYSLMSSADKVLAKQPIGGYQGLTLKPSANTVRALNEFMAMYESDVKAVLGLEES